MEGVGGGLKDALMSKDASFTANVQYVQYDILAGRSKKNVPNWGNVQYVQSFLAHEGGRGGEMPTIGMSTVSYGRYPRAKR
eukprot:5503815-Amphidinium_carterae.1